MNKNLSYSDIIPFIPNVKLYSELKDVKAKDLLKMLPLVILYQETEDYGHWTLLHKTPEGLEFFDSYGFKPDKEFTELEWKQEHYLADLLFKLSKKIDIVYSPYKFQKKASGINTCGRWVILRNLLSDMTIDEFALAVTRLSKKLKITPDELVVRLVKDDKEGGAMKKLSKAQIKEARATVSPEYEERRNRAKANYRAISEKQLKMMKENAKEAKKRSAAEVKERYKRVIKKYKEQFPDMTPQEKSYIEQGVREQVKELNRLARNQRKYEYLRRNRDAQVRTRLQRYRNSEGEKRYHWVEEGNEPNEYDYVPPVREEIPEYKEVETEKFKIGKKPKKKKSKVEITFEEKKEIDPDYVSPEQLAKEKKRREEREKQYMEELRLRDLDEEPVFMPGPSSLVPYYGEQKMLDPKDIVKRAEEQFNLLNNPQVSLDYVREASEYLKNFPEDIEGMEQLRLARLAQNPPSRYY